MKLLSVGGGDQVRGSPSARQGDADDASGRLTSFSIEEQGSRALRIIDAGGPCSL